MNGKSVRFEHLVTELMVRVYEDLNSAKLARLNLLKDALLLRSVSMRLLVLMGQNPAWVLTSQSRNRSARLLCCRIKTGTFVLGEIASALRVGSAPFAKVS